MHTVNGKPSLLPAEPSVSALRGKGKMGSDAYKLALMQASHALSMDDLPEETRKEILSTANVLREMAIAFERAKDEARTARNEALAERDSLRALRSQIMHEHGLMVGSMTMDDITRTTCKSHQITRAEIISPRRSRHLVAARHEAWWMAYQFTTRSLPEIGRYYNRDHTSIRHGINKHQAKLDAGQ